MPNLQQPYPPDAPYRVLKAILADGQQLRPGDYLPKSANCRNNPRKLEQLCRLRFLAPGDYEAPQTKAKPEPAPAQPKAKAKAKR